MKRDERMYKSAKARQRRRLVKAIRAKIKRSYYAHMRHLRKKYQKIRGRHHDEATN
jgi:ABC-type transporter MlaC component